MSTKPKTLSPRPAASTKSGKEHSKHGATPASAPGTLTKVARPLTLATLDAMPAPTPRHRLPSDMSAEEMGQVIRGLEAARVHHDSLSGVCATLAGLVCIEAKKRLPRGEYLPWVKTHLGKDRATASRYVGIADAFLKCCTRATFDQTTMALMDGAQESASAALDLTHPVTSAVMDWVKGRSFRTLIEDTGADNDGRSKNKGGNQHPKCPHCQGNLKSKGQKICPHCKKDTGAEVEADHDPLQAEAIELWTPLLRDLRLEGVKEKSFINLPDKGPVSREELRGLLTDLAKTLRAARPAGKGAKK